MENIELYILWAIYIFVWALQMLVFADVILSWLRLAWANFRPQFIANIIDPLYVWIKKVIPTTIGPLELAPIIVIIATQLIAGTIAANYPEINALFTIRL